MLETRNLSVFYGRHRAVEDVSVSVSKGEVVVMLGANGAGKSTFLRAVSGLTPVMTGSSIVLDGRDITNHPPHAVVEAGIALVPEDRGVFGDLTAYENLILGAHPRPHARDPERRHGRRNRQATAGLAPWRLADRDARVPARELGAERRPGVPGTVAIRLV